MLALLNKQCLFLLYFLISMQNNDLHFDIFMHPLIYWSSFSSSSLVIHPHPHQLLMRWCTYTHRSPSQCSCSAFRPSLLRQLIFLMEKVQLFIFHSFFDTNQNLIKFAPTLSLLECCRALSAFSTHLLPLLQLLADTRSKCMAFSSLFLHLPLLASTKIYSFPALYSSQILKKGGEI